MYNFLRNANRMEKKCGALQVYCEPKNDYIIVKRFDKLMPKHFGVFFQAITEQLKVKC